MLSGRVDGPECKMNNIVPEVPFGSIMAAASMLAVLVAQFNSCVRLPQIFII